MVLKDQYLPCHLDSLWPQALQVNLKVPQDPCYQGNLRVQAFPAVLADRVALQDQQDQCYRSPLWGQGTLYYPGVPEDLVVLSDR